MTLPIPTSTRSAYESTGTSPRVGVLHGAGYVGGELVRLLAGHPEVTLSSVTSRTFAGEPLSAAHPSLRGQIDHSFCAPDALAVEELEAILVAGEHGQSMQLVPELRKEGFDGPIVDLSADFRFDDPSVYLEWYDVEHPAPELLTQATYGLPEWNDEVSAVQLVANPGCYATGISLALAPLTAFDVPLSVHVTALTGASGSGATPSSATHFPTRDGNVRPYKVVAHQHEPEILQVLGSHVDLTFVPASGPWTRGIWGTAQLQWEESVPAGAVRDSFVDAYDDAPFVRCSSGALPSLQPVVHTPFCDLGWKVQGETLVIGFALDNLLKGAASQAVQNLNRTLGLPETAGLMRKSAVEKT